MKKPISFLFLLLFLFPFVFSCGQTTSGLKLRPLNSQESLDDFNQLVSAVRSFYGPLEYKEKRFDFNFDDWVLNKKDELLKTKNDSEKIGVFTSFLAKFEDAHVSLRSFKYRSSINTYYIPIFLTPLNNEEGETKAYAASVSEDLKEKGVSVYDELVSIDGQETMSFLPLITKYKTLANPESNKHLIYAALHRDAYLTDLLPKKNIAHLIFRNKEGKKYHVHAIWKVKQSKDVTFVDSAPINLKVDTLMDLNEATGSNSLDKMGAEKPFFLTDEVKSKFDLQEVKPNDVMLKKYGLDPSKKLPDVYAALYEHQGKTVLLARNKTYSHGPWDGFSNKDYMKYYRALFDQWDRFADVLLLDQTHNGGGSYCMDFFRLFIQEQKPTFVQANNADRRWIRDFDSIWARYFSYEANMVSYMSHEVEEAIDADRALSSMLPIMGGSFMVLPDKKYTWKKPMLVMVDELAGSCADAFPMLIKRNKVAKIFGKRTLGAGGNVESVTQLNHTGASLNLTRGLFTMYKEDGSYQESEYIENNGVEPDISYEHTVKDAREGYVGYLESASNAAIEQCKP